MRMQAAATPVAPPRNWGPLLHKSLVYCTLVICSLVVMMPFFWMITTSLKASGTEFTFPIEWLPNPPRWRNYRDGWTVMPFNLWAFNSTRITLLGHSRLYFLQCHRRLWLWTNTLPGSRCALLAGLGNHDASLSLCHCAPVPAL